MAEKMKSFTLSDPASRLEAKASFDGNLRYGGRAFHEKTRRSAKDMPASGAMHREQSQIVVDTGKERYQRRSECFEEVEECPVCGSADRTFFLHRYGLDVYTCAECGHGYLAPRPTFAAASNLYAQDRTATKIYTSPMQVEIDEAKSLYGLEVVRQAGVPAGGKILDFGCGSGTFLKIAHREGWERCVGIDPNPTYGDRDTGEDGVQFLNSTFEALEPAKLGANYDAITMWNVLEHLYDLEGILSSLRQILKPGGLLLVLVPNLKSLASQVIRERSATFSWKHPHHFTPQSLTRVMANCGFETAHLETVVTEIDNIKSALNGQWPYSGFGDPDHLFDFITPAFLHDHLLGSRILAVFRNGGESES